MIFFSVLMLSYWDSPARTQDSAIAGGAADYLLAGEKDLAWLPPELLFVDGGQVACGFGTLHERLMKVGISGDGAVLITGLGPVGLATGALCRKLGAHTVIGIDVIPERLQLAKDLGLCDEVLMSGAERAMDCPDNDIARAAAIRATRQWGRMVMPGEGGRVEFCPAPDVIHDRKPISGSWVTSAWLMEEQAGLGTHRLAPDNVGQACSLMASGKCGEVAVCLDEELTPA
jgi:threonine dehydrogenase-like Zn-dependent dehydrogenase